MSDDLHELSRGLFSMKKKEKKKRKTNKNCMSSATNFAWRFKS